VPYKTCIIISVFSYVVRMSRVVRSDKVIAHLVRISVISGIEARVRPVILAYSSCRRVKGSGLLRRACFSIRMRSLLSSRFNGSLRLLLTEADEPVALLLIEAPLDLPE
jgi:hypothetical protein